MEIKNVQKQKGFTLVEIAIVLVIIGLLLGGVLKGQELITNAKIKSVTSDFDNISAAYYAYQDRTGKTAGTSTGTMVDANFWANLRSEGFINGVSGVASGPEHALDGYWTAGSGAPFLGKNWICADNIIDTYASGMDKKKDDGVGTSGSMKTSNGGVYTATGALQTVCHEL